MQKVELTNSLLPSTTIIIRKYNKGERIGKVLEEIRDFVGLNNLTWDVIIPIKGNDNTGEIVKDFFQIVFL